MSRIPNDYRMKSKGKERAEQKAREAAGALVPLPEIDVASGNGGLCPTSWCFVASELVDHGDVCRRCARPFA